MSHYNVFELVIRDTEFGSGFNEDAEFCLSEEWYEETSPRSSAGSWETNKDYKGAVEQLATEYPEMVIKWENIIPEEGEPRNLAYFIITGEFLLSLEDKLKQALKETEEAITKAYTVLRAKDSNSYSKVLAVQSVSTACWDTGGTRFFIGYTFHQHRLLPLLEDHIGKRVYIGGIVSYHV